MGVGLTPSPAGPRGLLGDRALALIDRETGKVVSAKNPRKWARLFDFRSAYAEPPEPDRELPPVNITFPDGTIASSSRRDIDSLLSSALQREVTLSAQPPERPTLEEDWPDIEGLVHRETVTDEGIPQGNFFDLGVLHILTTATIDQLRAAYPNGRFESRRFRPNIVVRT